jgi:hypothetical protein
VLNLEKNWKQLLSARGCMKLVNVLKMTGVFGP